MALAACWSSSQCPVVRAGSFAVGQLAGTLSGAPVGRCGVDSRRTSAHVAVDVSTAPGRAVMLVRN